MQRKRIDIPHKDVIHKTRSAQEMKFEDKGRDMPVDRRSRFDADRKSEALFVEVMKEYSTMLHGGNICMMLIVNSRAVPPLKILKWEMRA